MGGRVGWRGVVFVCGSGGVDNGDSGGGGGGAAGFAAAGFA